MTPFIHLIVADHPAHDQAVCGFSHKLTDRLEPAPSSTRSWTTYNRYAATCPTCLRYRP